MKTAKSLRGIGIAIAVCLISAPIAFAITIALLPLWSWIESTFKIESVGHSGPAEWCYWTIDIIILACAGLIYRALRRKA